jgi:endo-1,4-beta-xylanase
MQSVVERHFSQISAENIMKTSYLQPTANQFDFTDADALMDYAQSFNATVHGHTLVWHQQLPQWMNSCSTASDCTSIMENHIATVVSHFGDDIVSWDVVNEAFSDDGSYRSDDSLWYSTIGKTYIEKAFTAARAANANAKLYYNDYNIEHNGNKMDAVIAMVNDFKTRRVPIDGIGFQMHVSLEDPQIGAIKAAFTKAVETGLMVKITELDMRLNTQGNYSSLTAQLAAKQQTRYQQIVEAYLDVVPSDQRGGITFWGVSDDDSWIIGLYGNDDWPLLFNSDMSAKPALEGVADALIAKIEQPGPALFSDSFESAVSWYKDDQSNVSGAHTYNSQEQTMNVDIEWAADGNNYTIATTFTNDATIDFTTPTTISFDVLVPTSYGNTGALAIQPFIMDGDYTPAYIGYQFGYTPGEWATITLPNVSPDFAFGYNGNPNFSAISRIGLQFIANGAIPPKETIQVDNVTISQ